ncbi:MAG: replicative DNA helicase [Anaerolineae bacterium]|nr:replicative DNA helicase [Anaerolineae bacterium]
MAQDSSSLSPDRMAPHSIEAEEAVLGSILLNPDALFEVASFLSADDFFIVRNGWVWEAIMRLHERNEEIDNVTVVEELRHHERLDEAGGPAYITYLINHTPSSIYTETYGRIVERAAIRRRMLEAASEIARLAHEESANIDEVIDQAESAMFRVSEQRQRKDLVVMHDAVLAYYKRIEDLYGRDAASFGVPTGFDDLDQLLGGFQRSDLLIVASRPGMGKTSWLLSTALNAARKGARVAIFSLEMSNEQLVQRMVSSETGISTNRLRLGQLNEREWTLFVEATDKLSPLPIYMDDTPALSPLQLRTKCRRLYSEHGLDLVMVDYMQLMNAGTGRASENRVQEISFISRHMKQMARELNVPVLSAAQLSRAVEQRQDKRPQLSDLRESGCLAGETLIHLPGTGEYVPIRDLAGHADFQVSSLDTDSWKLDSGTVTHAFCTGIKPVFRLKTQLGRTIRATANHKFLTFAGWKRLDELVPGDRLAVPHTPDYALRGLVRWDRIAAIEPDGESDVYDLTVPGPHNFVANNIIVHNSIEQDADVVMFIYRDEVYNENTERPNQADIIVAKHRNGPTDTVTLFFRKELTQFSNLAKTEVDYAGY